MKKIKTAVLLAAFVLVLTGCGINNSNAGIIKAGNTVITQKDYNNAFNSSAGGMLKGMGINPDKNPDNIMVLMAKDQVVSQLVVNALLNDEIEKNKITVSKADIDAAEKEITDKFGTKEQFLQILKLNGSSYNDFRKNMEQEIKIKKYVDSIAMVSIGEEEARKYYKENPDKFEYPEQVKASHILVNANEDVIKARLKKDKKDITEEQLQEEISKKMDEALKKAEGIRNEAAADLSKFAELAKNNSDDKMSAVQGGDLGFFSKDDMTAEFSKAAFALKPNTLSEIVKTPYGYHIIVVTDRKEAGRYTFEETKADIITLLENQEKMNIFKKKIAELGQNAKIEYLNDDYNPENIRKQIKEAAKGNPELEKALSGQRTEDAKN